MWFCRLLVIWCTLVTGVAHAIIINGYTATNNSRFTANSFPSAPVENTQLLDNLFSTVDFDFSGVGWDDSSVQRGFAMITPQHFVSATHFRPSGSVSFLNQDGVKKSYTVDSNGFSTLYFDENNKTNQNVSDLVIGKLTAPIPTADKIPFYSVLDVPSESFYLNSTLIVYGRGPNSGDRSPRVGANTIAGFATLVDVPGTNGGDNTTRVYATVQDNSFTGETQLESGDSGSPSFLGLSNGQLTIMGTHFAVGKTSSSSTNDISYDSFLMHYRDQIQDILALDGESLTFAAVPEPYTALGFSIVALTVLFHKRRRA